MKSESRVLGSMSIYKLSTKIASFIVIGITILNILCLVKILELTDHTALENKLFYLVSRVHKIFFLPF